jgi:hypothetical protein
MISAPVAQTTGRQFSAFVQKRQCVGARRLEGKVGIEPVNALWGRPRRTPGSYTALHEGLDI